MKKNILLIFVVLTINQKSYCQDERWLLINKSDCMITYLDTGSIIIDNVYKDKDGNYGVRAWIKFVFLKENDNNQWQNDCKEYWEKIYGTGIKDDYWLMEEIFYCENKMEKVLSKIRSGDGKQLFWDVHASTIPSNSTAEKILNYICEH